MFAMNTSSSLASRAQVRRLSRAVLAAMLSLAASAGSAHEITGPRATLVMRDGGHVSMTMYLDGADLLRAASPPGEAPAEALRRLAAMEPSAFARAWAQAQGAVQASTRLQGSPNLAVVLSHWSWPSAAQVQAALRQAVMRGLAKSGGAEALHPEPAALLEARAETVLPATARDLRVQFPASLGEVIVVSYRPGQQEVGAGRWSTPLRF
jgi:hypothetical protein